MQQRTNSRLVEHNERVWYLTLSADYLRWSLRDADPGKDALPHLSPDLRDELDQWNERYQPVVPLDRDARLPVAELIDELDVQGQDLATRIESALAPAKVRYYSEGHLCYLN